MPSAVVRYRFSDFTLSPRRRILAHNGQEVPLIPRYFDLLVLLIERRGEAVHRQEIFERVWGDVTVSESALSQAVRTIRRTLGDDSKEPRFIRTVSRHGYQFVFPDVVEEEEDGATAAAVPPEMPSGAASAGPDEAGARWIGAAAGGAFAGIMSGAVGGLILAAAPGSTAPLALAPVLAVIGGGCGAIGGAGVGAGLAFGESTARAPRPLAMMLGAAAGGGVVGYAVQWLTRWALFALVGIDINIGGGLEGLAIGAGAGLGFAVARATSRSRLQTAVITAFTCGLAGLALALSGRPLAGGTIHLIADAAEGSRATLAPLGRLIGEPDLGPVSGAILAFGEAATFGVGLALGFGAIAVNRSSRRWRPA